MNILIAILLIAIGAFIGFIFAAFGFGSMLMRAAVDGKIRINGNVYTLTKTEE